MAFISGGYTVAYNGSSIGQVEDGIELEFTFHGEEIRGDTFGDTVQDGVYRGGSCFISMTLLDYELALAQAAFWKLTSVFGLIKEDANPIGELWSNQWPATGLVLTDIAGTPAETKPATLTANYCLLAINYPVRMLFAPRLRRIPIRFQCFPDGASKFFVTT